MQERDILKWTRKITYQKGRDLYRQGKVLSFSTKTTEDQLPGGDGLDSIYAEVKGSGRNIYQVEIELGTSDDWDTIRDYYCECPAYDSYLSLCKHCVAVLLEYIDEKEKQKNEARQKSDMEMLRGLKGMPMQTTPALRELLQQRTLQRTFPLVHRDICGKVKLVPYLEMRYHNHLRFKIGADRMYVLKNIVEFALNMRNQKEHSYGKKLEFLHVMEAFEEESRPLVHYVCDWVWRKGLMDNAYYYDGVYHLGAPVMREMTLDARELENFLAIMGEQPFIIDDLYGNENIWTIRDEPVARSLTLKGKNDGIELCMDEKKMLWGEQWFFCFEDGVIYRQPRSSVAEAADFLACMDAMKGAPVARIDREDAPVFCREILPALREVLQVQEESFDASAYGVVSAKYEFYLDSPNRDLVLCKAEAVYGDKKFSVYDDTPSNVRDLPSEAAVKAVVSGFSDKDERVSDSVAISGEDRIYTLLTDGIRELQKIGKVYLSDSIRRINVRETPRVTMGVTLAGDMLDLQISSEEMSREELVEVLSRYEKKKKFYRLKNGDFVQMDEDGIAVLQEVREGLDLSAREFSKDTIRLPRYRALYLDATGKERQGKLFGFERDRGFRNLVHAMKEASDQDYEVPELLDTVMRPYQKEGFRWLKTLCHNGFGGILADDMGLGKTVQVIAFLLSEIREAGENDNRRTLVVAPASLVYNWRSELQRFAPELSVKIITGASSERHKIIEGSGTRDILLTSYDLLRRDVECYQKMSFFCEVIDEAQYIKNHNTKAARGVKKIPSSFRIALTGTPVENKLSELWSIFDYLMPGFLYSYKHFRETFEVPVVQSQDEEVLARLQKMIGMFVLRRLKREVLKDLPEKLEKNIYAPLEGEQKKLYQAHVQRMREMLNNKSDDEFRTSKIEILSELTRLRQLCCDPALVYEDYEGNAQKLETCLEVVGSAVEGGHKVLLFSQFTSMLQILQERLDERGISFYTLTGNTGKEKRIQLVEQFNHDDTSVFCISLKAGGTGLNLTAADVVVHYDPWWNLAVQNQATDRAHRIGQTNVVTVYKLVMEDSIEENILRLQEKKRELAEQILGGEEVSQAAFSREELLEILG